MKIIISLFIVVLSSSINFAQTIIPLPKIMVIPFTKDGEDLRTILDENINSRIAITKIKEGFDTRGYTTVDFVGKLKSAKDNQIFTSDNQNDIKSKIIEMAGCDIYVVAEVDTKSDNAGTSASVIISSYDTSTGNSLSNKVSNSGKFETGDIGRLISKAVDKCMEEFIATINLKFTDIIKNGRSILIDFSFAENSIYNMASPIGNDELALSDVLEEWFSSNSFNNNYHIQGTTNLKMIFDDVRIPFKDKNQNNYSPNKFALEIFKYLKEIGLNPSKEIKGSTVYLTIN
ncbi:MULTISPECIES: DUF6175 family protein [unclassified Flavobacterium]|uniref:DUF6175 family protein n=1 Tax=unclassified Flavobacterium TaxID=196869 RepID=UPI00086B32A5|nr:MULTISPECIES: DUF6175 family protein [unclassified Flavobacterium]MBN9285487.1 hypothetical protein [Flavobacterium sp.]ODS82785.1 MAG: hypothetical protein ABS44_18025 [Chryseobacterium sp. SCN 40-13]OJV71477.1 MAG: hypothetical protein BGO42_06380 [Flavobacterium sp. 40-81]